ncbi:hypothetical protein O1611_g8777 [Lasiodiplodia mahajangana]|uniref:Uncharacterized protein n=1 Tax=Lasiodiplodia mahajangana TaxID=1108764 RepID=A0ACC2JBJ9_9PEZI|nr:hypothetical protein O1611_g8777 [Lasiodiplodia mahajangana]
MAFTDRSYLEQQGFDDFISRKGQGVIILLCGPPGVGKTLTAEAGKSENMQFLQQSRSNDTVAEKSKVPLYLLSAGDLGIEASKVESGLNKALEICRLWNAVLLLDEADVFLGARDSNHLERNELVSIFLRRLEYYRGLMFLTTNRVNSIDSAFKSRIDLILPYFDLDEQSRKRVWENFIGKLNKGVADFSDADIAKLAKTKLDGREIKNSIKTGLILASHDKPLRFEHVDTVLQVRKRVAELEMQGPSRPQ